jgi:riboflavin kinase/FMN adenylyltransferase
VRDFLVNKLHVKKLVIGYDHQFGKNREGSIQFLKDICDTYDFEVIEIPAQDIDEVNVSSTKIRDAILDGNIEKANDYLGDSFEITGTVVKGNQLGRTIGYPTANIVLNSDLKLIPGNGVYAVRVNVHGTWFNGMMNIGIRPTVVSNGGRTIEVNIFDFEETIYDETVTVQFLSKWRDEQTFNGLEELKKQLKIDEETIRTVLSAN